MTDTLTPEKRSENMSRIPSRDTSIELNVRRLLYSMGYRYRVNRKDLPGKPDIVIEKYKLVPISFVFGYTFAWIGHFFFEKNKPATFKYPLYSFIGDWVMLKDIIFGKVKL